LLQQYKLK